VQNRFANPLQSSDALLSTPQSVKTHKPFLFPSAPFDK
jgi:hypothetical protein